MFISIGCRLTGKYWIQLGAAFDLEHPTLNPEPNPSAQEVLAPNESDPSARDAVRARWKSSPPAVERDLGHTDLGSG